jgi:hypothetical protein
VLDTNKWVYLDSNASSFTLSVIIMSRGYTLSTWMYTTCCGILYCERYHLERLQARCVTGQLKCDGTRAETRFRLSAKRTSPFKSAGALVQSTTGSRGVPNSGSNAGYTMFRGSVKSTGYPLHSPFSPSLPLPCVTGCHHISTLPYTTKTSSLNKQT